MCYSAQVEQELKDLERYYDCDIDWGSFEDIFAQRMDDPGIKIAKALELNFLNPKTPVQERIKTLINQYNAQKELEWQKIVFEQKKRLADAERTLKTKQTKKALNDQRIATDKIESHLRRLADLKRTNLLERDERIFPFWYAPIVISDGKQRKLIPARYHCRPPGKPAFIDKKFDGLYNARRDNLQKFWGDLFSHHHALMRVKTFWENVSLHTYEHRELAPGEAEKNLVLHFNPTPSQTMDVACIWSHWTGEGQRDLHSFAAITDEPPEEIAATGHDRVIISLKHDYIDEWLKAASPAERYFHMFDDRYRPFYEHRKAA
jgi:putative SOS response-associated peptidase YedK